MSKDQRAFAALTLVSRETQGGATSFEQADSEPCYCLVKYLLDDCNAGRSMVFKLPSASSVHCSVPWFSTCRMRPE
nr:hypothetical protein CFP56_09492 [Quercus suber]